MRVATWDDVGRIVGELPETAEASPRDWRVRKKLIAWERPLRKADYAALGADAPDGDILGARVADEGVKFALVADEPGVYFTTPHFDGYPAVLVRLAEIGVPELEELLTEAWLAQAPKTLAKAFLHAPSVLLLDEPSTGLDPGARLDFMAYLEHLRDQERVSVLLTTHILEEAERCDRVGILHQGHLVAVGTPDELKEMLAHAGPATPTV